MVSIENALGPTTATRVGDTKEFFIGRLFDKDETERATCIAKGLNGLTIQEATDLLDRFKVYLLQSVFSPEI